MKRKICIPYRSKDNRHPLRSKRDPIYHKNDNRRSEVNGYGFQWHSIHNIILLRGRNSKNLKTFPDIYLTKDGKESLLLNENTYMIIKKDRISNILDKFFYILNE